MVIDELFHAKPQSLEDAKGRFAPDKFLAETRRRREIFISLLQLFFTNFLHALQLQKYCWDFNCFRFKNNKTLQSIGNKNFSASPRLREKYTCERSEPFAPW